MDRSGRGISDWSDGWILDGVVVVVVLLLGGGVNREGAVELGDVESEVARGGGDGVDVWCGLGCVEEVGGEGEKICPRGRSWGCHCCLPPSRRWRGR